MDKHSTKKMIVDWKNQKLILKLTHATIAKKIQLAFQMTVQKQHHIQPGTITI